MQMYPIVNQLVVKPTVFCANCGAAGHLYKSCNHPVTSFGVICYRIKFDEESQSIYPEYLMVQRKDSLSYVEFLRGKYDIDKKVYLLKLFNNMTEQERHDIHTLPFSELWKNLWQVDDCNAFQREYNDAYKKFSLLKNGYILNGANNIFFDINYIIRNTKSNLQESEWGFPKGRRNINEKDFTCALREFREESGVDTRYIRVQRDQKPYEEIFSGSNHVRYRHVYYLACYNGIPSQTTYNPQNKVQIREIKDVCWFKYRDVLAHIHDNNVERKELFRRVNLVVMKKLSHHYNNHHEA